MATTEQTGFEQTGFALEAAPRAPARRGAAAAATVTEEDRASADMLLDACEAYVANSRPTVRAAARNTIASLLAAWREGTVVCACVRAEREREEAAAKPRRKGR